MPESRQPLREAKPATRTERDEASRRASDYTTEPEPLRRQVTTFYSFKGGVGRSQALCAVGRLLCQMRRKVLLVDVDLEAPGLSLALLDDETLRSKLGFLEIASDLATLLINVVGSDVSVPDDLVKDTAERVASNLHEIPLGEDAREPELLKRIREDFPQLAAPERHGGLYLLTCGRIYDDYAGGTGRLRLRELPDLSLEKCTANTAKALASAAGFGPDEPQPKTVLQIFVRVLHHALLACDLPIDDGDRKPEYVLVDSRAGLADIGGLCVRGLADRLVILSGLNKQNLAGTRMVIDRLPKDRRKEGHLTVVLSPVPEAEIDILERRIAEARLALGIDAEPILLHYHPRLALIEECFVEGVHRHTQLAGDYVRLCQQLQRASEDTARDHLNAGLPLLEPDVTATQAARALGHLVEAAIIAPSEADAAIDSVCDLLERRGLPSRAALQFFRLRAALRPEGLAAWGALVQHLRDAGNLAYNTAHPQEGQAAFEEAMLRCARTLELETDESRTHNNWGITLTYYAERLWDAGQHEDAAERFELAFEQFARAIQAKPDYHQAMSNWGMALAHYAERLWDADQHDAAAERFELAFKQYARAIQAKPDDHEAMRNWGNALSHYAERLWDADQHDAAAERFELAFKQYARAIQAKPDDHVAMNNWGDALVRLWRCRREDALLKAAREKCLEAEQTRDGAGAYNLACIEALRGHEEAALEWLAKAIEARPSRRERARTDPDLKSLRDHPRFRELTSD